jgi:hypothetical protein
VTVDEAEAARWLAARRTRFGAIVDDLSVQIPGDVTKPAASLESLPALMRARLALDGLSIVNWLPVKGVSQQSAFDTLAAPHRAACAIAPSDYDNRIVLGARVLPEPQTLRRKLETLLDRMGSPLARGLRVRRL